MVRVELLTKENITELYQLCNVLQRKDLIPRLDVFTQKYLHVNVERKSPTESAGEMDDETNHFTPLALSVFSATSVSTTDKPNVSNGFSTSGACNATHITNRHNGE